jgi:hypothetical protein
VWARLPFSSSSEGGRDGKRGREIEMERKEGRGKN